MALPDLLEPNLKVVFCGTAAGDRSALAKAYYAGPGNSFWSTLAQIRLTPRRLDPQEFRILLRYGIGLTDLAKGFHGSDRRAHSSHFDVESFRLKMEKFKPKTVAFNGNELQESSFDRSRIMGFRP